MHFDVSITHGVRNVGNANLDVDTSMLLAQRALASGACLHVE